MKLRLNYEWSNRRVRHRRKVPKAIALVLLVFTSCDRHDRGILPQIEYHSTSDAGPLILIRIDLLKHAESDQEIRTLLKTAADHYPCGFKQKVVGHTSEWISAKFDGKKFELFQPTRTRPGLDESEQSEREFFEKLRSEIFRLAASKDET